MFGESAFLRLRVQIAAAAFAIMGMAVAGGCKKEPEITRYQVPKEKPVVSMQPAASKSQEARIPDRDRMLAVIIPRGESAWFFKLADFDEAVGKHAEAFESMIESVTFPESAGGKPEWKLPEGWEQRPGAGPRFATLVIPGEKDGKPLEVSVITLPWKSMDEAGQVLANVNRWRGQISLEPLAADDLDGNVQRVKLADGEAILVDLHGTLVQ